MLLGQVSRCDHVRMAYIKYLLVYSSILFSVLPTLISTIILQTSKIHLVFRTVVSAFLTHCTVLTTPIICLCLNLTQYIDNYHFPEQTDF